MSSRACTSGIAFPTPDYSDLDRLWKRRCCLGFYNTIDKGVRNPADLSENTSFEAIESAASELAESTAIIIGSGGTGTEIAHLLVLLGIRKYVLIDNDYVDISNLNRQFFFRYEDVEKKKCKAVVSREALEHRFRYLMNIPESDGMPPLRIASLEQKIQELTLAEFVSHRKALKRSEGQQMARRAREIAGHITETESKRAREDSSQALDMSMYPFLPSEPAPGVTLAEVVPALLEDPAFQRARDEYDALSRATSDENQFNLVFLCVDNDEARRYTDMLIFRIGLYAPIQPDSAAGQRSLRFENLAGSAILIDTGSDGLMCSHDIITHGSSMCISCRGRRRRDAGPPLEAACTIASRPRTTAHCVQYVQEKEWDSEENPFRSGDKPVELDLDNCEHVAWVTMRAQRRQKQFRIVGDINYNFTLSFLKRSIPSIGIANALATSTAACRLLLKLLGNGALCRPASTSIDPSAAKSTLEERIQTQEHKFSYSGSGIANNVSTRALPSSNCPLCAIKHYIVINGRNATLSDLHNAYYAHPVVSDFFAEKRNIQNIQRSHQKERFVIEEDDENKAIIIRGGPIYIKYLMGEACAIDDAHALANTPSAPAEPSPETLVTDYIRSTLNFEEDVSIVTEGSRLFIDYCSDVNILGECQNLQLLLFIE